MKFWFFLAAVIAMAALLGGAYIAITRSIDKSTTEVSTQVGELKAHINSRVYKIDLDGNKFKRVKNLNITLQPNIVDNTVSDTLTDITIVNPEMDTVYVVIR